MYYYLTKSHFLFPLRAMDSVSAKLMCVARPVRPARTASLAWIMLTTLAAVVSVHTRASSHRLCCVMHTGRLRPREIQVGQAGRGLTLTTARGSDVLPPPTPNSTTATASLCWEYQLCFDT